MRYKKLGKTGLNVSVIGFGASPLGNEFGGIDPAEGERAVDAAIDNGINFFDTSPYYGRTLSEERLGKALAGKRHKVVLATKCGRYDVDGFDFSAKRVMSSVEESLSRLRTDHIDIFTAHDIEFGDREQVIHETLPAMRELKKQGKVGHVGISALPLKILADVAVRGQVDTVITYSHFNLMVRDLDKVLTPVARERGIGLINAAALHLRILTSEGPTAKHPASEEIKAAGRAIVQAIEAHGVDAAMAAVRFALDHEYSSSLLVGMSTMREVEANLRAMDLEIPPHLMVEIDRIVAPVRDQLWPSGRAENGDE
jgi:L-galactose dehydrogenase